MAASDKTLSETRLPAGFFIPMHKFRYHGLP